MFKLIKWIGIGTVGAATAGYFLFGSNTLSYVDTAFSSIRDEINGSIPIEFELKRASKLVKDIDPQVRKGHRQLIQAEVELEKLQKDVAYLRESVQKSEKRLKAASAAIDRGEASYQLADWREHQRLEYHLERTFEKHQNNEEMLKSKTALIERQSKVVTAARQHLGAIKKQKSYLVDMIADLRTQKAQLDTLQASSRTISFDDPDTALGQAKESLAKLKERLDVAQRCLEEEMFFDGASEFKPSGRDIAAEIQDYFSEQGAGNRAVTIEMGDKLSQVR